MMDFVQTSSFQELPNGELKRRRKKTSYKDIFLEHKNYIDKIAKCSRENSSNERDLKCTKNGNRKRNNSCINCSSEKNVCRNNSSSKLSSRHNEELRKKLSNYQKVIDESIKVHNEISSQLDTPKKINKEDTKKRKVNSKNIKNINIEQDIQEDNVNLENPNENIMEGDKKLRGRYSDDNRNSSPSFNPKIKYSFKRSNSNIKNKQEDQEILNYQNQGDKRLCENKNLTQNKENVRRMRSNNDINSNKNVIKKKNSNGHIDKNIDVMKNSNQRMDEMISSNNSNVNRMNQNNSNVNSSNRKKYKNKDFTIEGDNYLKKKESKEAIGINNINNKLIKEGNEVFENDIDVHQSNNRYICKSKNANYIKQKSNSNNNLIRSNKGVINENPIPIKENAFEGIEQFQDNFNSSNNALTKLRGSNKKVREEEPNELLESKKIESNDTKDNKFNEFLTGSKNNNNSGNKLGSLESKLVFQDSTGSSNLKEKYTTDNKSKDFLIKNNRYGKENISNNLKNSDNDKGYLTEKTRDIQNKDMLDLNKNEVCNDNTFQISNRKKQIENNLLVNKIKDDEDDDNKNDIMRKYSSKNQNSNLNVNIINNNKFSQLAHKEPESTNNDAFSKNLLLYKINQSKKNNIIKDFRGCNKAASEYVIEKSNDFSKFNLNNNNIKNLNYINNLNNLNNINNLNPKNNKQFIKMVKSSSMSNIYSSDNKRYNYAYQSMKNSLLSADNNNEDKNLNKAESTKNLNEDYFIKEQNLSEIGGIKYYMYQKMKKNKDQKLNTMQRKSSYSTITDEYIEKMLVSGTIKPMSAEKIRSCNDMKKYKKDGNYYLNIVKKDVEYFKKKNKYNSNF